MNKKQLKQVIDLIKDKEAGKDFNGDIMDFITESELKACENYLEVRELIESANDCGEVTDKEIIYYHNAMEYLLENDPSLQISLEIASDRGYCVESLNSEILASILYSQDVEDSFHKFLDSLGEGSLAIFC